MQLPDIHNRSGGNCLGLILPDLFEKAYCRARCLGLRYQPAVNVIILDLQVPGTDALEVIRRMGDVQTRAGLIIFGSQTNSVLFSIESMADAFGLNVLGVMTKPLIAGRLEAVIASHLKPPEVHAERVPTLSFA